jgi:hypothetical protein
MEKKRFFEKGSLKCVIVLLVLMLVSGGLLSILNDLLYVSEAEALQRALTKIYGSEVTATISDEDITNNDTSIINKIYNIEDGNKLFNVTGLKGYKGGTITLWVVVEYKNDKPVGISKVELDTFDKQTRMGDFKQSFYNGYTDITKDWLNGTGVFASKPTNSGDIQNIVTGATYSSNAANNAVNGVLAHLRKGA